MNKFTHLAQFVQYLFEDEDTCRKAKMIVEGILKARSPRLSDIARGMAGREDGNYKCIQRFLGKASPQESLATLVSRRSGLRDRRPDRNAQAAGQEDGLCWHP